MAGPGPAYFAAKAARNFARNLVVNGICVATIAIAVFIFSATLLTFVNARAVIEHAARGNRLVVYIRDGALPVDVERVMIALRAEPAVAAVTFTGKEQALADFKRSLGAGAQILDGLEMNPLPASADVTLKTAAGGLAAAEAIAARVATLDGVESVNYGREIFARLERVMRFLTRLGWGVAVLMVLAVVFIVANTIRLNIFSRREEIEVQQLVGATGWFIRAPFLLEGAIQGLLGGALAQALLLASYLVVTGTGYASIVTPFGELRAGFLPGWAIAALCAASGALGIVGSWFALGKHIKRFMPE
jgi:cell division transport system permease protein